MPRIDIPSFAQTQLSLLAAEVQAEIEESSALVSLHSPSALRMYITLLISRVLCFMEQVLLDGHTNGCYDLALEPFIQCRFASVSATSSSRLHIRPRLNDAP